MSKTMDNVTWLESMACKTDADMQELLAQQLPEIQKAYQTNDQALLKKIFGGAKKKLACRTLVFQL